MSVIERKQEKDDWKKEDKIPVSYHEGVQFLT